MTGQDGTAGTAGSPAESAIEWAKKRGLSRETLAQLGVTCATEFFPDLGKKTIALRFPYQEGYKARSIESKSFVAGGGFKSSFWNIQRILEARPGIVYITEGELDACALVEAGIPADCVLSVPNGAKEKPADHPKEQRGYAYALDTRAAFTGARIVWCGDNDGPGHALRADMVAIFGAARFSFVEWPSGAKDAGDALKFCGPGPVLDAIEAAKEWPVSGIYRLDELPEPPPMAQWRPGFDEWENKVFLCPRTLSVVTGHPGHGKTALWQQIWRQVIDRYGLVACMASMETRPSPHIRRQLRTLHSGKLERAMSDEEKAAADAWIQDRYLFLEHDEQRPSLEWFLERAAICVIRHGARIVQIDPWNRFEHNRGEDTETEYIGRALREMYVFANQMNCHVQILAHPAKMDSKRRGDPPSLEDISGSKHWHNMVDQGFVLHRPKMFDGAVRKTEAVLYHLKARFEECGYAAQFNMNYLLDKGRFVSTDYENGAY